MENRQEVYDFFMDLLDPSKDAVLETDKLRDLIDRYSPGMSETDFLVRGLTDLSFTRPHIARARYIMESFANHLIDRRLYKSTCPEEAYKADIRVMQLKIDKDLKTNKDVLEFLGAADKVSIIA